jgi:hypothetical protein
MIIINIVNGKNEKFRQEGPAESERISGVSRNSRRWKSKLVDVTGDVDIIHFPTDRLLSQQVIFGNK